VAHFGKSTPQKTTVDNMVSQKLSKLPLFTAKLGSDIDKSTTFYTFGYVDQPTLQLCNATDFNWTSVNNSNGFWQVPAPAISVNGVSISRPKNQAIVDTGTTLILVDDATCEAIYAAVSGSVNDPDWG
jgi:hypothetical protein